MPSPHAPRAASRELLHASLTLLAATLLTGCDNPGKVVEEIAQVMLAVFIVLVIVELVLIAVALLILIMNIYRLASGRPSIGWGTTAFVLGLMDLSMIRISSTGGEHPSSGQSLTLPTVLLLGIALVLFGGLNLFLAIRRKSQAAASARLIQEDGAKPVEAEQEPPKVN